MSERAAVVAQDRNRDHHPRVAGPPEPPEFWPDGLEAALVGRSSRDTLRLVRLVGRTHDPRSQNVSFSGVGE